MTQTPESRFWDGLAQALSDVAARAYYHGYIDALRPQRPDDAIMKQATECAQAYTSAGFDVADIQDMQHYQSLLELHALTSVRAELEHLQREHEACVEENRLLVVKLEEIFRQFETAEGRYTFADGDTWDTKKR